MSVITKKIFINEFEDWLSDKLTARDIQTVVKGLTENLGVYEMERCSFEDESQKEFRDLLEIYCDAKTVEGRSKRTMYQYRYQLNRFMEYDPTPIRQLTVYNFRQYLAHEKQRGIKETTLAGNRSILCSFFEWLFKEGLLPVNPCGNLSPVKRPYKVRNAFSAVEVECIKNVCSSKRDKAIVHFLLSTGCRIGEVIACNRQDIDFQNMQVKVYGKGAKERYVYFDSVTSMHLKAYLDSRTDDNPALFVGRGAIRLSQSGHEARLKTLGKRCGVTDVFPHRFRHTFATVCVESGMDIYQVKALMGHSKIETTLRYIDISQNNLRQSYNRMHL